MNHLFISYELAQKLKEKGFDEKCLRFYNHRQELRSTIDEGISNSDVVQVCSEGSVAAPIYQQVIDWLRNNHNIFIYDRPQYNMRTYYKSFFFGCSKINNKQNLHVVIDLFREEFELKDYYIGQSKAIEEALKLIE